MLKMNIDCHVYFRIRQTYVGYVKELEFVASVAMIQSVA